MSEDHCRECEFHLKHEARADGIDDVIDFIRSEAKHRNATGDRFTSGVLTAMVATLEVEFEKDRKR